jgi:hypothetical protein
MRRTSDCSRAYSRARTVSRQFGQALCALAGTSSILLSGCLGYPDADERFDDPIIYTRYDESVDFADYKTFAIESEVTVFEEDDGEIGTEALQQDIADQLIERTVQNLEARGYTQVAKAEDPDLGVTVSLVKGRVTGYYTDYWGYYWGYPYWGYSYPYYYTYSYDTNTLLTDTVDLKNAPPPEPTPPEPTDPDAGQRLSVKWTALVYGVSQELLGQNLDTALSGIDQSFKQSLYLRTE